MLIFIDCRNFNRASHYQSSTQWKKQCFKILKMKQEQQQKKTISYIFFLDILSANQGTKIFCADFVPNEIGRKNFAKIGSAF